MHKETDIDLQHGDTVMQAIIGILVGIVSVVFLCNPFN